MLSDSYDSLDGFYSTGITGTHASLNIGDALMTLGIFTVVVILPAAGFSALIHFLFSLPMRRRDRARFFLDLLETALDHGQPVEQAIISAAACRDDVMGIHFHLVAAQIEDGHRLSEALKKAPNFLSPQIIAMLETGEKLGDLKKILPACRENLRNPSDSIQGLIRYMLVILVLFLPIYAWVIWIVSAFVIPKFKDVAESMDTKLSALSDFVFGITSQMAAFEMFIFIFIVCLVSLYIGGPGMVRRFQFRAFPIIDWIAWRVPWNQKRLQRNFSAMLAVLLDGGVPEIEAVRLAGNSTVNEICRRRTGRVIAAMEQGVKLDDAVRILDDSGEFHWRLTNATHSRSGFLNALRGWHESLDARAFQQEGIAAQLMMSGLVITNGVLVALIATGMFGVLVTMLRGALDNQ